MIELSFRQSLAMSAGSYAIFFTRPITTVMLLVGLALLLLGLRPVFTKAMDWRAAVGLEPVARPGRQGESIKLEGATRRAPSKPPRSRER
jgi:hypothetical protein